jgi:hypothetical protein
MNQKTTIEYNGKLLDIRVEVRLKGKTTKKWEDYIIKGMAVSVEDYNRVKLNYDKVVLPKELEHRTIRLSLKDIVNYD